MSEHLRKVDLLLSQIAEYTLNYTTYNQDTLTTAQQCLLDGLACATLSLQDENCKRLLGPIVPGTIVPKGSRVPGTDFVLDPIQAAFNIGTMVRWLDFNDTWLAAEWGHPSDNLGAILAVADYVGQQRPLTMQEVLLAMIKAYEIQGILALENAFNVIGLDHVILVKIASSAVATHMLGGDLDQIINAVSNAWIDGHSLRTYRHGINTGSRKSWAAGDASARGVRLAWLSIAGEPGYPHALDAKQWGFRDVLWHGQALKLAQPFGSYVMDNILFKVKHPAEFHAQTALEAALELNSQVRDKIDQIERIEIYTQEAGMRIINKTGVLRNFADRDHCIQYIVAVGLLYGDLTAESYADSFAANDPRIDQLRNKMVVKEERQYTKDYLDPNKRAIANSVQVFFNDGTKTTKLEIMYPLGHKRRRSEAGQYLHHKFTHALGSCYSPEQQQKLEKFWQMSTEEFYSYQVTDFILAWCL